MTSNNQNTFYFGYGSNLWLEQMAERCPTSRYEGVARLSSYRWMINSRGYANVVEHSPSSANDIEIVPETYGLVYTLQALDEKRLDVNEGVPFAYTKEYLDVDFWPSDDIGKKVAIDGPAQKIKMLVYIDRHRVTDGQPKEEYIYRMNRGIEDAISLGVPKKYIDTVMRKFIPADDQVGIEHMASEKAYKITMSVDHTPDFYS